MKLKQIIGYLKADRNREQEHVDSPSIVTTDELLDMLRTSRLRLIGLKSTIKHYGGMIDSDIKEVRKRHYAKLKEAAVKLLDREESEHDTILLAISNRIN